MLGCPASRQTHWLMLKKKAVDEMLTTKELATKTDLKELELRLLKWQIGGWVALATIMAKGFGWLGF